MDDLQARLDALFLEELQDNLRTLGEGIRALGDHAHDGGDADLLRQLFRAAHSLKGAAHSAGVTSAIGPCHRLEELLADVQRGDRPVEADLVSALLEDVDALGAVEQALARSHPDADADADRATPSEAAPPPIDTGDRAVAGPSGGTTSGGRARVDVGRLDQLVNRAGALVAATGQVGALAAELTAASVEASAAARRRRAPTAGGEVAAEGREPAAAALDRLSLQANLVDRQLRRLVTEVADTAQQLRLQPISDVVTGLDRAIREVSRATGTEAQLVVTGGDVEVDRDIGDAIREPLIHLVRNAVDHGVESPAERSAAGKPPVGTVGISAAVQGSSVAITVVDDGAGLDLARLREAARALGTDLPEDEGELVFLPGLSTASAVTAVSGRGVGLDAVRDRIESLGGTVHVRSPAGRGTEVAIQVPRTLAVLQVVVVETGEEVVAVPSASVGRLHRLGEGDVEHLEGRLSVATGDERVPAVVLSVALGLGAAAQTSAPHGIGVQVVGEAGVLIVEDVRTELDVVVQPLPSRLGAIAGILGAAVLPSGRTALIVNPSAALRAGLAVTAPPPVAVGPPRRTTVLLAEDTLTTRALERSILEGAGYDVIVAVDGAEAWELLGGGGRGRDRQRAAVDVVVSDVDMPHMGGIELCRAIRSSPHLAELPVVLVTSLAREEDRQRGMDAGANAYIVKSAFEQRALLDAVGRLA